MKLTSLFSFLAIVFLAFYPAQAAERVRIHGSTTVDANLIGIYADKIQNVTETSLQISANGSTRGVKDLLAGAADMAMIFLSSGRFEEKN